jgi:hypothetical protein
MTQHFTRNTELFACRECGVIRLWSSLRCPVCEHGPENSQPTFLTLNDARTLRQSSSLASLANFERIEPEDGRAFLVKAKAPEVSQ